MIRSHNVQFRSCFCPGNEAVGTAGVFRRIDEGKQSFKSVQARKALIRHNLRKLLMSNWLPRMDSNHDKVIQSFFP